MYLFHVENWFRLLFGIRFIIFISQKRSKHGLDVVTWQQLRLVVQSAVQLTVVQVMENYFSAILFQRKIKLAYSAKALHI